MDLGGFENAKIAIEKFREKVRRANLGEIHFAVIDNQGALLRKMLNNETGNADAIGAQGGQIETDSEALKITAQMIGIDSFSTHTLPLPPTDNFPKASFDDWVSTFESHYKARNTAYGVTYNLGVTIGWDSSPRTVQSDVYEDVGYPFTKIIYDGTPEKVGKLFEKAKEIFEREETTAKCIFLHSFNEWTEGAYLEPDEKYGYAYLEEVKRVFGK
jgi:hypothetical protein